jgi:hypothetical protein
MADGNLIDNLFNEAESLSQEKESLMERTDANRQALRYLAKAGQMSDEQKAAVDKLYPPRERKKKADATATTEPTGNGNAEPPAAKQTPAKASASKTA